MICLKKLCKHPYRIAEVY